MSEKKAVILSAPILIGEGIFKAKILTQAEAQAWVDEKAPQNFCGHETTRVLNVEPMKGRDQCLSYTEALVISPEARLEFGREYTKDEIMKIGVKFTLIRKFPRLGGK